MKIRFSLLLLVSICLFSCQEEDYCTIGDFEYDPDVYRLSPLDCGTTIYSLDEQTCTFVDSGYTVNIDDDCLTAEEVALYYLAFKSMPPNYFTTDAYKPDTSSALEYGKSGRCASRYNYGYRTDDGSYTKIIGPFCNTDLEESYYWELDIDLDGSYNNGNKITRGMGRVIIVELGLAEYGGDGPVCFYTENHYSSFVEFYNYLDGFGESFSSNASKPHPITLHL